jgi:hypothetical protein
VVPGRGRDDALALARRGAQGQRRDPRRRAAQLERPGPLQVLELEPDVGAGVRRRTRSATSPPVTSRQTSGSNILSIDRDPTTR